MEKENIEMDYEKITVPPPIVKTEALLEDAPQNIPGTIELDNQGRLLKKWLEFNGPIGSIIKPYDDWVTKRIPRQLMSHVLEVNTKVGEKYEKAYVSFTDVEISRPYISISGNKRYSLTPRDARDGSRTYSAELSAKIVMTYSNGKKEVLNDSVSFGSIPVMVRSVLCNTTTMSRSELIKSGECVGDPGGYFIIKGMEKVIMIQEKLRVGRIFMFNSDSKGSPKCKLTNETDQGSSVVSLMYDELNKTVELKLGFMGSGDGAGKSKAKMKRGNTINVLSTFRMLGVKDTNTMLNYILLFVKDEWKRLVWVKLQPSFIQLMQIGDDFNNLSQKMGHNLKKVDYNVRKGKILKSLLRDLFPQVREKTMGETIYKKLLMLSMMTARYVEHLAGLRPLDDRDNWGNKRLETAGRSMEQLFSVMLKMIMSKAQESLNKRRDVKLTDVKNTFDGSIITDNFVSAFAPDRWGVKGSHTKKENITEALKPDNLAARYAQITKINTPTSRRAKQANIRLVQMSQLGYVCPVETPEGEHCGVVKNSAISNWISLATDTQIVTELIKEDYSIKKDKQNNTVLWINGQLFGWCMGPVLHEKCITLRRSGRLPFDTCIVLDKEDDILYIYTDAARPTRPLLIVNQKTGKLVIEEKKLWGSSIPVLLRNGALEYIDAFEQEHIQLAHDINDIGMNKASQEVGSQNQKNKIEKLSETWITDYHDEDNFDNMYNDIDKIQTNLANDVLQSEYTHCEMDPTAILGFSASLIPLINHNQAPRNTYQCSMGRQALGVHHSNHTTRFDTTSKCLAYPSRPLFETQMSEVIGIDELPAGQTVMLAIMTYTGYDQEDAIIMNKSSIERGLFRMVVYKAYKAIAKNIGEIMESFARPPLDQRHDKDIFHAITENGIARVGAIVKEGDVLISKLRRISNINKEEYDFVKVGVGQQGVVDKVLYTTNHEDKPVVSVKIRTVRAPIVGDKFASRQAQKATIGLILPEQDMPFIASGPNAGMTPDIIFNPHGIPSRMTLALLLEIVMSKVGALRGERMNATAFRSFDLQELMRNLKQYGYSDSGKEVMISGVTGKPLRDPTGKGFARIFVGPSYYQALRHHVLDKIQMRARGAVKQISRQPVSGRANRGGQRFGEMERDALISHGASAFLRERLCLASDVYDTVMCRTCGTIAVANANKNNYDCPKCGDNAKFGACQIPYAYKLLMHLLAGAGFNMTHTLAEKKPKLGTQNK